jgi:hypothetical protein
MSIPRVVLLCAVTLLMPVWFAVVAGPPSRSGSVSPQQLAPGFRLHDDDQSDKRHLSFGDDGDDDLDCPMDDDDENEGIGPSDGGNGPLFVVALDVVLTAGFAT